MRRTDSLDRREAERAAEDVISGLGLTSLPIDPFSIAQKKGIHVEAVRLDGCSGCLVKSGDAFGILYSTSLQNDGFERFTVSHELGHYFLPGHAAALFANGVTEHRSESGFVSTDPLERQADCFAAALLMPERLFKKAIREEKLRGFQAIAALAERCKTSLTSTAIRFTDHADDSLAVVMSRGTSIEWCFLSEPLRTWPGITFLRRGSRIPTTSCTYSFNQETSTRGTHGRREGTSMLLDWIDGAPDIEVMEDVTDLGKYGRTLTVLFSEDPLPDEDDDTGLEEDDE